MFSRLLINILNKKKQTIKMFDISGLFLESWITSAHHDWYGFGFYLNMIAVKISRFAFPKIKKIQNHPFRVSARF